MVDKSEEHVGTHRSGDFSESEDEDNVSVGPQGGDEPPQLPTPSLAPVVNKEQTYRPRSASENAESNAHNSFSEEDETVPTLNPMERRQLKRVEQKLHQTDRRYILRRREKGISSKPP